jgi:hypothetical protein
MGVANSPDIFQSKTSQLMVGLDFVSAYLDDVSSHRGFLSRTSTKLRIGFTKAGRSKPFATEEFEYIGYLITTAGICPLPS